MDLGVSFIIELVWTCVLMLVIFLSLSTKSKYRNSLLVDKNDEYGYSYAPIITGFVLMALIYSSIAVGKAAGGAFAGHMFPLITLPGMSNEAGLANVSFIKGLILLFAQFLAMFIMWYLVFKTQIFN